MFIDDRDFDFDDTFDDDFDFDEEEFNGHYLISG